MKKLEKTKERPNLYDYLKIIALITMLIDHIGFYIFPEFLFLRLIGRIAFPIFLFLVGFSGSYKWRWDIPILGLFLRFITFFISSNFGYGTTSGNILIGITISRFAINIINTKNKCYIPIILLLFIIIHPFYNNYIDYGSISFFYLFRGRIAKYHKKYFLFGVICFIISFFQSLHVFDFGFQQGNYTNIYILFLFYFTLFLLFFLLSKENMPIISGFKYFDLFILKLSKHALAFYGIHIIILIIIGLFKFGFI